MGQPEDKPGREWTPPNAEFPPPKAGEPELHRAARVGDHEAIRKLAAARAEFATLFDLALDPGAYKDPATPLMVAAGSGDGATIETVKLLLELGADPKQVVEGRSAAMFALSGLGWNYRPGGDAARLKVLLEAGSPLIFEGREGKRLVADCAGLGDPERLKLVLAHGGSPNAVWDAETARKELTRFNDWFNKNYRSEEPSIVEQLRASFPDAPAEFFKDMDEDSARRDAEYASAPSEFEIPLFCAARAGSAECIHVLLSAGADPVVRDNSKRTAVYYATSEPALRALMTAGLPIEDSDTYGWSPLVSAVSDGDLNRVRALVSAGANVNASHDHGYTVFMSAVGSGRRPDVLRFLVESGADPHAVSEYGYNAFHAAIDVNSADANAPESVRDTFGYLMQLGVNIELKSEGGRTPLAFAIDRGTGLEVQALCELGADPNAPARFDCCGPSGCKAEDHPPLFAAIKQGVEADIKTEALLRAGADALAVDTDGHTALAMTVAGLCSHADDYPATFRRFFTGLQRLNLPPGLDPADRAAFLAAVRPQLAEYIREFAAGIPIKETHEFAAEWRRSELIVIELLAAYEGWARHQALRQRAAEPGPGRN